jgi:hypothetical protein
MDEKPSENELKEFPRDPEEFIPPQYPSAADWSCALNFTGSCESAF